MAPHHPVSFRGIALFDYITDPSGASDYTANIVVQSQTVWLKYLSASSVAQRGNITWAGQTFGGPYESNGIPQGTESIQSISCSNGICPIKVHAPSFALVFLTPTALQESSSGGGTANANGQGTGAELGAIPTRRFGTTVTMVTVFSGMVDPAVLATSNGRRQQIKGHLGV